MALSQRLIMASLYDAQREQRPIFERASALAVERDDAMNIVLAEYSLAYHNFVLGEATHAMYHSQRALEATKRIDNEPLRVQVLATWGQTCLLGADYPRAIQALNDAISLQRPFCHKPRLRFAYAYSLGCKSMLLGDQGFFDAALVCLNEAAALTNEGIHQIQASLATMKCGVFLWQGQWKSTLEAVNETLELGHRIGSRYMLALGTALGGYAKWQLGDESGANDLTMAMHWFETNDQAIWVSLHQSWSVEILVSQGRYQAARDNAAKVLRRMRKGERIGEAVIYCALAEIPPGPFSRYDPKQCFDRARDSANHRQSRRELALIDQKEGVFLSNRSDTDRGQILLERACSEFSTMQMYWYAAHVQEILQELDRRHRDIHAAVNSR